MRVRYATLPAQPDQANEDHVAASGEATVLIDGAGTPAGSESGCVHGVAWYAAMLAAALLSRLHLGRERPLPALLADAIDHVRWMHANTCDLTHPGSPSATVVAVRREGENLAYLVLADSVLVLGRPGWSTASPWPPGAKRWTCSPTPDRPSCPAASAPLKTATPTASGGHAARSTTTPPPPTAASTP